MKNLSVISFLSISLLFVVGCTKKAPTGPQSLLVNEVKINYLEQGEGDEAMVFIHGYCGALGNWKYVLELLPEEYHAYALDLRGFGQSDNPGSYKLTEMVEDIYAFVQKLGIKRFTYVGHSLGGKIGYQFALDHPDVLKGMFLIAPAPAHDFIPAEQREDFINQMAGLFGSKEMLQGFIVNDFVTSPSGEFLNEFVNDALAADPTAVKEAAGWWISANLEPQLSDITVPTLILAGAKDRLPVELERRYAGAIKGCRLEVLEDMGHMMPWESPQKVVDLLTGFITDLNKK